MKRESCLYVLFIIVPAIVGAMGGLWLVRSAWQKMWIDEYADLDAQAELIAEVLSGKLAHHDHRRGGGPGPRDGDDERMDRRPRGDGKKSVGINHPKGRRRGGPPGVSDSELAEVCDSFAASDGAPHAVAFKIDGVHGAVRYIASNYPSKTGVTGKCRLKPPVGEGDLIVARADGGAAMRTRAGVFLAFGIGATLLLSFVFTAGGMLLLRMVHRERMDAQSKISFFDSISHELKTPLAGIRINAELLLQGRIPDEKRRGNALSAILIEADRLGDMVDRLLDFRRLEKGTYIYNIETFDLADFVRSEAESQAIVAAGEGRVVLTVKDPGVIVSADRIAIRHAGINLISNAVKYSDGPVEVEVDGAEIRYMDRGPGIPHGDEERIFERYYRVDSSITQKVGGSGIGLSIARSLARGMGGDVVYAHRPGGGSVFTFKLRSA